MKQVVFVLGIVVLAIGAFAAFSSDNSKYLKAATAGGDYLVSHMHDEGSFVYEYDPIEREEDDSYNILRHAGTTYSLLELYEATHDKKYLTAADNALAYLTDHITPCPTLPDAQCVEEADEIKLGGNGLALLAFAKYIEVTGDTGDLMLAEDLARFIVGVQSSSGEFTVHKMSTSGGVDDFESEYYPSEAMFGLAKLSQVSGNRTWLDAAHKGAAWIIASRESIATEDLPHDHWFLYALNELAKDKPDEAAYVDHAKRLTEAIVALQHRGLSGARASWNGGYYEPPRSTPTATRNEGLGAAYHLFTRANEQAYAEVAKDAMRRGIEFTLRTQFTPRRLRETGASGDALGGFHESLDEYEIRIDYVQHNISALLAFDQIVNGK